MGEECICKFFSREMIEMCALLCCFEERGRICFLIYMIIFYRTIFFCNLRLSPGLSLLGLRLNPPTLHGGVGTNEAPPTYLPPTPFLCFLTIHLRVENLRKRGPISPYSTYPLPPTPPTTTWSTEACFYLYLFLQPRPGDVPPELAHALCPQITCP